MLATGESTTALGNAAANRAMIAIPAMDLLSAYRSRGLGHRARQQDERGWRYNRQELFFKYADDYREPPYAMV
jgi:hypothetical protein